VRVNDVQVRPATAADAPALAELAALTFPLACPPSATPASIAQFIAENLTTARFEEYLADPGRALLVAEADGAAVGYVMLVHGEPYDADVRATIRQRPTTELSKIYVHPDAHGSGIAGMLLDHAIEVARAIGATGMWLGTNQLNERAQGFYAKSGFEKVGTKRFWVGDHFEDDYVFELVL
jgi:ribosomal protein S18 acetylase RimI-like enzyme